MNNNSESSNKTFFSTNIFKFFLATFIIVEFLLISYIYFTSDLIYEAGWESLNNTLLVFRVPIYIASGSMAILALLSYNHRSHQTYLQIEEQIKQNKLSNHFRNMEEFVKYIEANSVDLSEQVITSPYTSPFHMFSIHSAYPHIFPYSPTGNFSVSENVIQYQELLDKTIRELIRLADTQGPESFKEATYNDLIQDVYLNIPFGNAVIFKYQFEPLRWIDSDLMRIFPEQLKSIVTFLKLINYYSTYNHFSLINTNTNIENVLQLAEDFCEAIDIKRNHWFRTIDPIVREMKQIAIERSRPGTQKNEPSLKSRWESAYKKYTELKPWNKEIVAQTLILHKETLKQDYFIKAN